MFMSRESRAGEKVSLEEASRRLQAYGDKYPDELFRASELADIIWPDNTFRSSQGAARAATGVLKRLGVPRVLENRLSWGYSLRPGRRWKRRR